MWGTTCNKNTVQDGHGKQHNHNRNAKTLETLETCRGTRGPPMSNVHDEALPQEASRPH